MPRQKWRLFELTWLNQMVAAANPDDVEAGAAVFPFTVVLDDLAGNSLVENPCAPDADPAVTTTRYDHTPTQDIALGLQPSASAKESGAIDDADPSHKNVTNAPRRRGASTSRTTSPSGGRR